MNKNVEKIEKIGNEYSNTKLDLVGTIRQISYSDLGQTMIIRVSGDVPIAFSDCNIVIVHPESKDGSWVGLGQMGLVLNGKGVGLNKIPLPRNVVEILKGIYLEYTAKETSQLFFVDDKPNNYAIFGLFQTIVNREVA